MDIPDSVAFTDGNAQRPQDGYYLHGLAASGEHVYVQILQSDIPDLQDAGRLLFNRQLVEVRSLEEARIISLLISAEFADNLERSVDYNPGPITQRHALQRIRDSIVDYVQSDEYVDIARNGVQVRIPHWAPGGLTAKKTHREATAANELVAKDRKPEQPTRRVDSKSASLFTFTIREWALVCIIVGLAFGWGLDHWSTVMRERRAAAETAERMNEMIHRFHSEFPSARPISPNVVESDGQ
jgi:hypothetical protein